MPRTIECWMIVEVRAHRHSRPNGLLRNRWGPVVRAARGHRLMAWHASGVQRGWVVQYSTAFGISTRNSIQ